MGRYVAGDTFKLKKNHYSKTRDNYEHIFQKGNQVTLFKDEFCYENGIEICVAHKNPNRSNSVFRMHYIPFTVLESVINFKICVVPECRKEAKAGTYCHMHYKRQRNTGKLEKSDYLNKGKNCYVDGCDKAAGSKGMCYMHYQRDFKNGDPSIVKQVSTYEGISCRIKDCEEKARSAELCNNHYHNYKYHFRKGKIKTVDEYVGNIEGENLLGRQNQLEECAIKNCKKKPKSHNLCATHYANFHYHKAKGNVSSVEEYLATRS